MGKFLKFFSVVVVYVALASILLGLGIVGVNVYIPELLGTDSILRIVGYSILLGLPFVCCFLSIFSFTRVVNRFDEDVAYEEEEEVVKETRAERKIRKLCDKLEKEGVFVIW